MAGFQQITHDDDNLAFMVEGWFVVTFKKKRLIIIIIYLFAFHLWQGESTLSNLFDH